MSEQSSQDVIVLDPLQFPLRGSRLIEASAGTGKTYTIALLYLRLVLGHGEDGSIGQGLTPPEILVVTFTDAAVKELRDRIRRRLVEAVRCFADKGADNNGTYEPDELLSGLRDTVDPALWPACTRKLQLAADWMDEAAISTIHAWCNRMLGEHAFDSRSFFGQTLIKDEREHSIEAARDYWRTFIYPLSNEQVTVFQKEWSTPDALLASAMKLLSAGAGAGTGSGSQNAAAILDQTMEDRKAAAARVKAPWDGWIADLRQLFDEARSHGTIHGNKIRAKSIDDWFSKITAWAEDPEKLELELTPAAFDRLTPDGLQAGFKAAAKGAPDTAGKVLTELLEHPAWEALADIRGLEWLPDGRQDLLSHACAWIGVRIAESKQRRGEIGFDDMLRHLDTALAQEGGDNLAAVIRRQFPVAMIDEFQDTDPLQYRIFDSVYSIEQRTGQDVTDEPLANNGIFLIGDPKQAIYAFRNADIHTYLQARSATSQAHYSLHTNYRSSTRMVAAVNHLFGFADRHLDRGAFRFATEHENPLPFVEVEAHANTLDLELNGEVASALTFWQLSAEQAGLPEDKHLPKGRYVQELSERCASAIVTLLKGAGEGRACFRNGDRRVPIEAGNIAILVNNFSESTAIRLALQKRGLASVYLSDRSSVLSTVIAQDILIWLRACAEPNRLGFIRAALGTGTLEKADSFLAELTLDEAALEREIQRFTALNMIWTEQGVLPMLRELVQQFDLAARMLAQDDSGAGERDLTDLLHIAEVLQQESAALDGLHALVRHYSDMIQTAAGDHELLTVRLESDADIIQVVTIHKSKGLEYPLVFLPFAMNARPVKATDTMSWHDDNGTLQVAEKSGANQGKADDERLAEDVRKLYVALTRARYATWVGIGETQHWRKSALGYLLGGDDGTGTFDHDAHDGLDVCLAEMIEAQSGSAEPRPLKLQEMPEASDARIPAVQTQLPGEALRPLRNSAEHWWIASFSALASGLTAPDSSRESTASEAAVEAVSGPPTDEQSDDVQHVFERGAATGVFLHDMLEWMARRGFAAFLSEVPDGHIARAELRDLLARRCRVRGWTQWIDRLQHWLMTVADTRLLAAADQGQSMRSSGDLPAERMITGDLFAVDQTSQEVAGGFTLASLQACQPELEFWFEASMVSTPALDELIQSEMMKGHARPALMPSTANGMLKGFIDLVLEHDGCFYVLDYKSNWLGESDQAYTEAAMTAAVLGKRYDLQLALYLLALHRLLRLRLPDYDYDRHVGGGIFLFLRGSTAATRGVFHRKPSKALIERLDALFCAEDSR